jgi:hypothetical protein
MLSEQGAKGSQKSYFDFSKIFIIFLIHFYTKMEYVLNKSNDKYEYYHCVNKKIKDVLLLRNMTSSME